ncbi:MAG: hypothetical protein MUO52_06860 [Desulfobacterales bacterium]|nr:hypothetical protein [Desulfobacterales bacterium]
MNPLYALYATLTSAIFVFCSVPFWVYTRLSGRYQKGLKERLGFLPPTVTRGLGGFPRVWIHAASLGEIKVAGSLMGDLEEFIPGCEIILSTATDHGYALAAETFRGVNVLYAPIDLFFSVRKALMGARPDVMVFLETEIWPAWLFEAHRMGIRIALINGRISPRSFRRYRKLRPFFREVLRCVDVFSMISPEDAKRIGVMGAELQKTVINGNAKYDSLAGHADPALETRISEILNLQHSQKVFVAGSTREGEEAMILDAYERILKQFPEMILVLAPRHIVRTPAIEALLRRRGFRYQLRTDLDGRRVTRTAPVVIMNTFGELFGLYSVGTINFCGGSLVALGGQNPLEAAVWGKVVFYGPSMEDFLDAKALLEKEGAGNEVSGPEPFAEKAMWLLNHPDEAERLGRRAREAVMRNRGAARRHARVIADLLLGNSPL